MLVRLATDAENDLAALYAYVQAEFSPAGAAWYRGLVQTIDSLETLPERGMRLRQRPHLRRIVYGKGANRYVIVYSIERKKQVVLVTNILHGRTQRAQRYL